MDLTTAIRIRRQRQVGKSSAHILLIGACRIVIIKMAALDVPDFVLDIVDGELKLSMPRFNIPEIRVNRKYAELLVEAQGSSDRQKKEAATFVKQKLEIGRASCRERV